MMLLFLTACTPVDHSDNWTYGNQGPVTDYTGETSTGGDSGDGGDSTVVVDTGDTGDTGAPDTRGEPPTDGTGYDVGDTAYNLSGTSGAGTPWSLYDQFGSPVVLIVGHMDLGTTMNNAMEAVGDSSGAVTAAVVGRSETSVPATADDAMRYSSEFGISNVLYDPNSSLVEPWSSYAPPKAYVIDEQLIIRWTGVGGSITDSAISAALEAL